MPDLPALSVSITPDRKQVLIEFRYAVRAVTLDPDGADQLVSLILQAVQLIRAPLA